MDAFADSIATRWCCAMPPTERGRAGLAERIFFQRWNWRRCRRRPRARDSLRSIRPMASASARPRIARAVRAARRTPSRGLSRLAGGRVHRKSGARTRTRHQCAPDAPDDERSDRVPVAATLDRTFRIRHRARTGPSARHRWRIRARPSGRSDVREPAEARTWTSLQSWARRDSISCYRLYDADMPEYSFAIDLYQPIREAKTGAGSTSRNTHRPLRSLATRRVDGAKRRYRSCPESLA